MITAARECPSCKSALPADAVFCHKCGTATSFGAGDTPVAKPTADDVDPAEAAQRAAVQNALGETYQVRRLLGRGGFAEVRVAYDKRLKREIAVKTIRGDLVVNETLLERFQREAEAVAKLRHPNVIPIYSVGEAEGTAFFTMPLIEGESLASVIEREGRIPVAESIRILREASNALHAAHRVGIIHRDVKPENIMLEGPERSAIVMDFGIAKSDGAGETKGLTGTGMLIGTPDYMSPEQAIGERSLDARSDQYSLAMVGYRMLTGRVPFAADSVQTLIFKTVTEIPTPASEINADVPAALSAVLSKALSKRAADRFESMAAFSAALTEMENASRGAASSRERRRVELATRIQQMQAAIPAMKRAIVAAVVAAVATAGLVVAGSPRVPFDVAAGRDDALFAAKTFLNTHAGPARRSDFASFVSSDSVYRFLRQQLGRDSAARRASTDLPPWRWNIRSLSPEDHTEWHVWLGSGARIVSYRVTIPDSASGAHLAIDSARTLALRELGALGWDPARLKPQQDSIIPRKARSEYLFRWTQTNGAIAWRGTDSARARISVTVSGDRVAAAAQSLRLPDGYVDRSSVSASGPTALVVFVGVIVAIILVVRRQQTDELQWSTMIKVFIAASVIGLLGLALTLNESMVAAQSGVDSGFSQTITGAIGFAVLAGAVLCVAVAGESLVYQHQSGVGAGLDLTRGRLLVPELPTSVAVGYALGGVVAAVGAAIVFLSQVPGVGTPILPSLPFGTLPFLDVTVGSVLLGAIIPVAVLFVYGILRSIGPLSRVALFGPAVMTAAFFLIYNNPMTTATAAITVLVLTFAIARFGLLAAMLTYALSSQLESIVALLRTGDSRSVMNGLMLLVIFLAPAALAYAAYRRYSTRR